MKKRFKGRMEHFGLLLFDNRSKDYINLNRLGASILRAVDEKRLPQLLKRYESILSEAERSELNQTVKSFIRSSKALGYLDKRGKPDIEWINDSYDESRYHGSLSAPTSVCIQATNRCNLKCAHCGFNGINDFDDELSLAEFDDLFSQLAAMGTMKVSIICGEPLMRQDIYEILESAVLKDLKVSVTTNAALITPSVVKKLERAGVSGIKISLEGIDKESYEVIRGKNTYSAFLRNLKLLSESDLSLSLGVTLMKTNILKVRSMVEFAVGMGIGKVSFNLIKHRGENKSLIPGKNEYFKFMSMMTKEIFPEFRERIRIDYPPLFFHIPRDGIYLFNNFGCIAGNTIAGIDPKGGVSPCIFIKSLPAEDNIKEKPFSWIWAESKPFRKIRAIKAPAKCASCEYYHTCSGGCRAQPAKITQPDIYCIKEVKEIF